MRTPGPAVAGRLLLGLLLTAGARDVAAQTGTLGAPVTVNLAAVADDRLQVTILSGGVQTIPNITPNAINPFPTPVQIRTEWDLPFFFGGTLALLAYFTTPAQALTTGAASIPSSRIEARTSGANPTNLAAFTPIAGNPAGGFGTAGGTVILWNWNAFCGLGFFCRQGDRTDQLDLRLNLVGYPLAAGNYAGVLNIRAVIY